jgi:predicted metal-binding membrane protein
MTASRSEGAFVALLLGLAGLAWWSSIQRMHGMDAGPWTALGTLGWFLGVWTVMMAAMMLPSALPAVTVYARLSRDRTALSPLLFVAGYLAVWAALGLVAYGLAVAGSDSLGGALAWSRAGRSLAAAALLCAATYQLTPLKDACLRRCRSPLGLMLGSWRPGPLGGLRLGVSSGAWCAGCCWALMASLFALGVMSIFWMAVVAGLVAVEKILPWRRLATTATAAFLLVLALLLLAAPGTIT